MDKKGDPSTLIEKARFNFAHLPHWMKPAKFNSHRHNNLMKLINPDNGNTITGESTNAQFSRGGRFKGILMDEFPYWPYDYEAFTASGQSSPCRIVVGTPYGKQNKFAELRFEENAKKKIAVERLHWTLHPLKYDNWYEKEKARMSEDEIARELDINYQLSMSNRVFREFKQHHIAKELKPITGRKIIRSWDFGYHCPACLILQLDSNDRLLVLKEFIGSQVQLTTFANDVLKYCQQNYPKQTLNNEQGYEFEDLCDPPGAQRSDKSTRTSIEILNTLGVFPNHQRSGILDGIELIRRQLTETIEITELNQPGETKKIYPMFAVHQDCRYLIEAFQGGYRYTNEQSEKPYETHPYEDVMDCLRYAVVLKCGLPTNPNNRRRARHRSKATNKYTRY